MITRYMASTPDIVLPRTPPYGSLCISYNDTLCLAETHKDADTFDLHAIDTNSGKSFYLGDSFMSNFMMLLPDNSVVLPNWRVIRIVKGGNLTVLDNTMPHEFNPIFGFFDPDTNALALQSYRGGTIIWDLTTSQRIRTIDVIGQRDRKSVV